MAHGHFHASKVVYQRNAETTVAKTSDGKRMDPHDRLKNKYKHETNMKFLQQKEKPQLKVISMFIPCSSCQIIDIYSKTSTSHLSKLHFICQQLTRNDLCFQPFQLHTPFTTPKFVEKKWAPPTSERCRNELKAKRRCSNNST